MSVHRGRQRGLPLAIVALAALLAGHLSADGRDAVIVLSGGNIDLPLLREIALG